MAGSSGLSGGALTALGVLVLTTPLLMAPHVPICPTCPISEGGAQLLFQGAMSRGDVEVFELSILAEERTDILLWTTSGGATLACAEVETGLDWLTQTQVCTYQGFSTARGEAVAQFDDTQANLMLVATDPTCHVGRPDTFGFCSETCPCGFEDAVCQTDDQCADGLRCLAYPGNALPSSCR